MTSERPTDAEFERLKNSWLCYHCNTRFTDGESASRHFGTATNDVPLCQADKMLIVIARKERDEYASIRAHVMAENMRLRSAIEDTITCLERRSTSAPVVESLKAVLRPADA